MTTYSASSMWDIHYSVVDPSLCFLKYIEYVSFASPFPLQRLSSWKSSAWGETPWLGQLHSRRHGTIAVFCPWLTWLSSLCFSRSMGTHAHELWDSLGQCQNTFKIWFAWPSAVISKYSKGSIPFYFRALFVTKRNNGPFPPSVICEQHGTETVSTYV